MNGVKRLELMVCPKCFAEIPETSAFCLECGARIKEDTLDSLYAEGSDREVYPDIAQANLMRMRGQWEEATQICINVLRRFPSNETAHALLGDIYSDQGLYEEAIHWYEMLVDLEPSNAVYRAKLDQLRAIKTMKEAEQKPPLPLMDVPETQKPGWSPSQRTWIYTLLGILAVGTVVSAFVAGMRMTQASPPSINRPELTGMPPTTSFTPGDNTQQTGGHHSPEEMKKETSPPLSGNTNDSFSFFLSTQEATLNRTLTQNLPGTPVMVCFNPVSGSWTIRGKIDGGALSRERVLREAYSITDAFYKAMPAVSTVNVVLMVPSRQTGTDELLFAAEVPQIPIEMSLNPLTDENIRAFFQNARVWWNPQIPL